MIRMNSSARIIAACDRVRGDMSMSPILLAPWKLNYQPDPRSNISVAQSKNRRITTVQQWHESPDCGSIQQAGFEVLERFFHLFNSKHVRTRYFAQTHQSQEEAVSKSCLTLNKVRTSAPECNVSSYDFHVLSITVLCYVYNLDVDGEVGYLYRVDNSLTAELYNAYVYTQRELVHPSTNYNMCNGFRFLHRALREIGRSCCHLGANLYLTRMLQQSS